MSESLQSGSIATTIPIYIKYEVLQEYLRAKFIGEIISKKDANGGESKYAKILNISICKSEMPEFDIEIHVKLETLLLLYSGKEMNLVINAALDFDPELQKIWVEKFDLDSKGNGWLADQLLETVVNNFMYDNLKEKMNFDLMEPINAQLKTVNDMLEGKIQAMNGIYITGSLDKLQISRVEARDSGIWVFLTVDGWGVVEVEEIML